jgi:hypothetical protein
MTLPASGQLSMSDINTELGNTSTAQITLNDTKVRTLLQRTTSASEIGMNAAFGKEFYYIIYVLVVGGGGAGGAGRRDRSGGAGSGGGGGGHSVGAIRVKKTNFSGSIIVGNGGKPDYSFEAQNGFAGYSSQLSISSAAQTISITSGGGGGGGGNTRTGGAGGTGINGPGASGGGASSAGGTKFASASGGGGGADDRTHGQYNKGGDGVLWPYDMTYYSGGGGGGGDGGDGGYNGGAGGGGSGKSSATGDQGSDYTGGGGGGGASWGNDSWNFGGRGGSGLVKIMYDASYGVLFRIDTGATTLMGPTYISHLAYITDHAANNQESKTIVWVGS